MPAHKIPIRQRFDEKWEPCPATGCHIWTANRHSFGYGQIKYKGKGAGAHRVAWELANGPVPEGECVLHKCDVPACVNPDHLYVGTKADNNRDRSQRGRWDGNFRKGSAHPESKLDEWQVKAIRQQLERGVSQASLAKTYSVNPSTISLIASRKRWGHI